MNENGRHELKLPISFCDYLQLKSQLRCVAKPDEYALDHGVYRIQSLYFDNYNDKALREKLNGVNQREKFRIRLYNHDPSFIRLEKKRKNNGLCFKDSAAISKETCECLLNGQYEVLKEQENPLCLELYTKMQYQQLRPKNIVDYQRMAFVFPAGNVRVTLDTDIRSSSQTHLFLSDHLVTTPIPNFLLLEVKYDDFLPEVIRNMVSLHSRQTTAFSKYAVTRHV